MTTEQRNRLQDLINKSADVIDIAKISFNIELNDDFHITAIFPNYEEVSMRCGDTLELVFPLSALSDDCIEQVFDEVECVIEKEQMEIDRVIDHNYWSNI